MREWARLGRDWDAAECRVQSTNDAFENGFIIQITQGFPSVPVISVIYLGTHVVANMMKAACFEFSGQDRTAITWVHIRGLMSHTTTSLICIIWSNILSWDCLIFMMNPIFLALILCIITLPQARRERALFCILIRDLYISTILSWYTYLIICNYFNGITHARVKSRQLNALLSIALYMVAVRFAPLWVAHCNRWDFFLDEWSMHFTCPSLGSLQPTPELDVLNSWESRTPIRHSISGSRGVLLARSIERC